MSRGIKVTIMILAVLSSRFNVLCWLTPPSEDELAPDHFHHAIMDNAGVYNASWEHDGDFITFDLKVKTRGAIGFGLSPDGSLNNSDLYIGWVTEENKPVLLVRILSFLELD